MKKVVPQLEFNNGALRKRLAEEGVMHIEESAPMEGHDFGTTLPDADKAALLEYLKTL